MSEYKCLIDGLVFSDIEALHFHLKELKISQKDYYLKYHPKKDLLNGKPLPFKSPEHYLLNDFENKNNLKKYLKDYPEEAKLWSINWLKKRKEAKSLIWAPIQVELRSLPCPSIMYYDWAIGYNKLCDELSLKIKFRDNVPRFSKLPKNSNIIIDTREQRPLLLNYENSKRGTLNIGDYALEGIHDKKIYIERKSLLDFISTLTKDLGRFHRELDRAKEIGAYVIMMVENSINDCLGFNYLSRRYIGLRYVKTNPSHVFKNLRDTIQKYENFQPIFVDGRLKSENAIIKIFQLGEQARNIDLQLMYERDNNIFNNVD